MPIQWELSIRYTLDLETHLVYLSLDLYLSLPPRPPAQGCASWARNPKGPQITPFCHQLGRHPTVLDATSAGFRQISARRSLGGSRPLNLNFFFHHVGAKKCQNLNFWDFFENGHPQPGRIWAKMEFFEIFLKMDTTQPGRIWAPWAPWGSSPLVS